MGELLALLSLAREVRAILVEVGRLIEAGRAEEAAELARVRAHGYAAGKAAYEASKRAGKAVKP
jgi:hypothetical protein